MAKPTGVRSHQIPHVSGNSDGVPFELGGKHCVIGWIKPKTDQAVGAVSLRFGAASQIGFFHFILRGWLDVLVKPNGISYVKRSTRIYFSSVRVGYPDLALTEP